MSSRCALPVCGLLVLGALLAFGCGSDSDCVGCDDDAATAAAIDFVNDLATLDVNPTPGDRVLARLEAEDGRVVTYLGTKDDDGNPTAVDELQTFDEDGDPVTAWFDDEQRPLLIANEDGSSFAFDWSVAGQVTITSTDADGHQATGSFDPDTGEQVAPAAAVRAVAARSADPRQTMTATVNVSRNGRPYNPAPPPGWSGRSAVVVTMTSVGLITDGTSVFDAVPAGTGVYSVQLPNRNAGAGPAVESILRTIGQLESGGCATVSRLQGGNCLMLSSIPTVGPGLANICAKSLSALKVACAVMGAKGDGTVAEIVRKLRSTINSSVQSLGERDVFFTPQANVWQGGSYRAYHGAVVRGTLGATLTMHGQMAVNIDAPAAICVSTNPAKPAVGQQYVATANFYNVPAGGQAVLNISGPSGVVASTSSAAEDGVLTIHRTRGSNNQHTATAQITSGASVIASDSWTY